MTNGILKALLLAALVCAAAVCAPAQDQANAPQANGEQVRPTRASSTSVARVPVIVIGSAAKATWVTTKFTTKHLAAPVAKTIFLTATPALAKMAVRYGLPYAARLSLL